MLGLAFVAVGSFCRRSFASASIRFRPSGSFFPCADVLSSCGDFFGSHAPRVFPFFSLHSFRRAGCGGGGGGEVSGCLCVASRGSSSPPARHLSSERGGGAFGRSFGAREFASVSSVHSWTGGPGVALFGRLLLPALSRLGLPPHLCTPCEMMGREGLRRLALFSVASHLCTLCEVMRRESLRRPAPVRVPPRLPDLWLGKPGRSFEPALRRIALVTGLVAHTVAPLSVFG